MTAILDDGIKPLYVKIPKELHGYLDEIKEQTGISKGDTITLLLIIARRLIDAKTIVEMFDDYMLRGEDGIEIVNTFRDYQLTL